MKIESFAEESRNIHEELYEYGYIDKEELNKKDKVDILCIIHGVFTETVGNHLNGIGCQQCNPIVITKSEPQLLSKEEDKISKAKKSFKDITFDKLTTNPLTVHYTCSIHGPSNKGYRTYIEGNHPCLQCRKLTTVKKHIKNHTDYQEDKDLASNLIRACKTLYKDYVYPAASISKIQDNLTITTRLTVVCPKHGIFNPVLKNHLSGQSICPTCSGARQISKIQLIRLFTRTHGERFDYSRVVYTSKRKQIVIRCNKHNRLFSLVPNDHISSQDGGCIQCKKERQCK